VHLFGPFGIRKRRVRLAFSLDLSRFLQHPFLAGRFSHDVSSVVAGTRLPVINSLLPSRQERPPRMERFWSVMRCVSAMPIGQP
jgi:hypothetical protein